MSEHEHAQVPVAPSDGDTFTCPCGYVCTFVVLEDGLPGEWVERGVTRPREQPRRATSHASRPGTASTRPR